MKDGDKLKQKYGTQTGFSVPDGYFDHVFAEIGDKLPALPESAKQVQPSRWQRLKPYVYLAAMFAGIWCTMKLVSMVSNSRPEAVSLDNPPELVAQAMESPEVVAHVYSAPSAMVVADDYLVDEYADKEAAQATGDQAVGEQGESQEDFESEYSSFVNVEDIDLNQLYAALMEEDSPSDDYYYI